MIGPHKVKSSTGMQGITEQLTGKKFLPGGAAESISAGLHDEEEPEGPDYLQVCAQELIDAVKSGSAEGVASALRAAFEELEEEPHVEGPHEED